MLSIYKASAGSGKTFVLAREYIKFILGYKAENGQYRLDPNQGDRHRRLLAITFTNKATEEMKRRIVHQLAVLAGMEPGWSKPSPYLEHLIKTFGCSPGQLATAAEGALRGVLYDFGALNISTIDSFFQSILRSFAREAEVNGNYAVEIDQNEVIEESVDELMTRINRANPSAETRWLLNWLERFMLAQIEDGGKFAVMNRSSQVHSDLITLISNLSNDDFREHEADIIGFLRDDNKLERFIAAIASYISERKKLVKASCKKVFLLSGDNHENPGINANLYKALCKWAESGLELKNGQPNVGTTIPKIFDGSTPLKPNSSKFIPSPELENAIHEACGEIISFSESYALISLIRANLYQLGLLRPLADRLNEYRHEHQAILLADTNKIINSIIANTDSPFLYEKIGTRYEHYLIDEFQDTSSSQWDNLKPLLRETDANGTDSLIIGDVKQSIYRFRNSDSSLLSGLHTQFAGCETHGETPEENTNWRSSREVVTFNNTYFKYLAKAAGYADMYSNVTQRVASKHVNHQGFVEFNVFDTEAIKDAGLKKKAVITEYMARHLRRQLEEGRYRPCDIAILVRAKSEGEAIISTLRALCAADKTWPEFRIVSDKSLLIETVPSVAYIVSTLRLLTASDARKNRRSASEREKALFINQFEHTLATNGRPEEALTTAVKINSNRHEENAGIPMPELPPMANHDMISLVEGLIASLTPEARKRDALAIATIQDMVTSFVNRGASDIRSFIEWWDERGHNTSVPAGKDEGAINILTIHKSKGLEWKCVYVPFAELYTRAGRDVKWFDIKGMLPTIPEDITPPFVPLKVTSSMENTPLRKEYEKIKFEEIGDRLNLLYVAFTRATDELIVGLEGCPSSDFGKLQNGIIDDVKAALGEESTSSIPDKEEFSKYFIKETLTFGQPTTAIVEEKEQATAIESKETIMLEDYPINPTRNMWEGTKLELDKFNHIDNARERGVIIHEIMAGIRTANDIEGALKRFRLTPDGVNMSHSDFNALSILIRERVSNPNVFDWFNNSSRILMERTIALPDKQQRRFDRVVWTSAGEIHIIDYKTGHQPSKKYRRKMAEYKKLMSEVYAQPVRAFLYYLDTARIIEM